MSALNTALDVTAQELAKLRAENAALRERAGPLPPKFDELLPGQVVTAQQLAALYRDQHRGKLKHLPGELKEVTQVDDSGRRHRHYFGDPAGCWDAFKLPVKRVTGWG